MKERPGARGARQLGRALAERCSYANLMSTIAVFGMLATGGAYAASKIGPKDIKKNAVRAKHIKKNQVRAKHIKKNQVRAMHIKDGAVTAAKLADGEGLQGPKGDQGVEGLQGPKGDQGEDAPEAWALVGSNGTLLKGSGVTAVSESAAYQGQYEVTFAAPNARNECGVIAHPSRQSGSTALNNDAADVSAEDLRATTHSGGGLSDVIVAFHDAAGTNVRPPRFSIAAFC